MGLEVFRAGPLTLVDTGAFELYETPSDSGGGLVDGGRNGGDGGHVWCFVLGVGHLNGGVDSGTVGLGRVRTIVCNG